MSGAIIWRKSTVNSNKERRATIKQQEKKNMSRVTLLISQISHRTQYKMFHFIHLNGLGLSTKCYKTALKVEIPLSTKECRCSSKLQQH